jgi:collagenase-like PrtC family protease
MFRGVDRTPSAANVGTHIIMLNREMSTDDINEIVQESLAMCF